MFGPATDNGESNPKRQKLGHEVSYDAQSQQQQPGNYGQYPNAYNTPGQPHMYLGQDEQFAAAPQGAGDPLASLSDLTHKAGYFGDEKPDADASIIQQVQESVSAEKNVQLQQNYAQLQHNDPTHPQYDFQYSRERINQWQLAQAAPSHNGFGSSPQQPWGYGPQPTSNHTNQTPFVTQSSRDYDPRFHGQPAAQTPFYQNYGGYDQTQMASSEQNYHQQGVMGSVHTTHYHGDRQSESNIQYMAATSPVPNNSYNTGFPGYNYSNMEPQHYPYSSQSSHMHQGIQAHSLVPDCNTKYAGPPIKQEPGYSHLPPGYQGMQMPQPVYDNSKLVQSPHHGYIGTMCESPPVEAKPDPSAAMLCAWDTMEPVRGTLPEQLVTLETRLSHLLETLTFGEPVTHIYNPIDYAVEPHRHYVNTYCKGPKHVMFLGMNPGPYGMAQTGVPFGEINMVKDWLKVEGAVTKPLKEHPKRPVWGLECPRSEISGSRFWGFFKSICETPETFFQHCFVHNYCPLLFMAQSGRNLTPPDLRMAERRPLNDICDRAFCDIVRLLDVKIIIGVGKFAQERAKAALRNSGMLEIKVECIMHPSPANPTANKGWQPIVERQLREMGVLSYLLPDKREIKSEAPEELSSAGTETQGNQGNTTNSAKANDVAESDAKDEKGKGANAKGKEGTDAPPSEESENQTGESAVDKNESHNENKNISQN